QERVHVNDHDFRSLADGIAIPHGLYDITLNRGYLTIGTSHDTSEFACDCLRHYWYTYGSVLYPHAASLLLLCDCGGSNSARYYIFKELLQALADELGREIRLAHYPPYTSKYNPIEHRLFPHVSRACQGLIFRSIDIVKEAMGNASAKTGLQVVSTVIDKVCHTGKKVAEGFKEQMKIVFDEYLPKWNYRAIPVTG
ncbi:MAG: ISAzo13 family transposase, partial [Gammaproteobacteria bacterium]|nr:ISAzo13 family transposase [Gammaproteobacteria bacterium]